MSEKRAKGQYFTFKNPFNNQAFKDWGEKCDIKNSKILEPFAGKNSLIEMLEEMNLCQNFAAFDIEPKNQKVEIRDTLKNFPTGFKVCITNPPYLAQNSAKRQGLDFAECEFDDLYKFALKKCLENCPYVGAIIPASFLNAKIFRNRLSYYVLLNSKMFCDTQHPVCLALFEPKSSDVKIYGDEKFIGNLLDLEKKVPQKRIKSNLKFNDCAGNLGLFAIDNTINASIRFCLGEEISANKVHNSSRSITRISVDCSNLAKLIKNLNEYLAQFRAETYDVFLTPFKGLRKDGLYRRRLDYGIARSIINEVICKIG